MSDEEWAIIGPHAAAGTRAVGARPAQDNRRFFEGMLWPSSGDIVDFDMTQMYPSSERVIFLSGATNGEAVQRKR